MIKLLNAKQLKPLAENTNINNRKQNVNTNLGGLSQDTFEFSKSKNLAFAGKPPAQNIADIANKLEQHGLKNGLVKQHRSAEVPDDKYIIIINEGLSDPQSQEQAKNLVIDIGKLYDPVNNQKLADDIDQHLIPRVINPLLRSNNDQKEDAGAEIVGKLYDTANNKKLADSVKLNILVPIIEPLLLTSNESIASSIKIMGKICSENSEIASTHAAMLNRFTLPLSAINNERLACQAVLTIGNISAKQPDIANNSADTLTTAITDEDSPDIVRLQSAYSLYDIANANVSVKEKIQNNESISQALINIHNSSPKLTEHVAPVLAQLAGLYGESENVYAQAAGPVAKLLIEKQHGDLIEKGMDKYHEDQESRKKELTARLDTIPEIGAFEQDRKKITESLDLIDKLEQSEKEATKNAKVDMLINIITDKTNKFDNEMRLYYINSLYNIAKEEKNKSTKEEIQNNSSISQAVINISRSSPELRDWAVTILKLLAGLYGEDENVYTQAVKNLEKQQEGR